MHDIFSREPDPLDGMLRPPSPPDAEELRRAVYAQTRRVFHRRRRLRQCAYAVALAVSFAAGLLVMRVVAPTSAPPASNEVVEKHEVPQPAEKPTVTEPAAPALVWEWQAVDSGDRRAELYLRAGETYLKENDPLSALRCYANSLDNGSEQDRDISPENDDFLLMAIKNARQKEKEYAKNGS
jgi:hypothetical protein